MMSSTKCTVCSRLLRHGDDGLDIDDGFVCASHCPTYGELLERCTASSDPSWQNSYGDVLMAMEQFGLGHGDRCIGTIELGEMDT